MAIERTQIDGRNYTLTELMKKYNLSHTTAVRARKRGYLVRRTRTVECVEDVRTAFDTDMAYRAAGVVFWKKFRYMFANSLDHFDDMKQMAVLKMVELSAKIENADNKFNVMCAIAKFEMYNYMKQANITGAFGGKFTSFEANVEGTGLYACA